MHAPPALSYSIRRLALFLATLVLTAVLLRGTPLFVVLLIATVVSSLLSYVLLAGFREAMAHSVARRIGAVNARIEAGARAEDAALDAAERPGSEAGETGSTAPGGSTR